MWSKDEEDYLKEHYGEKSVKMIAKSLSKTKSAVYQKANSMGLESESCGSGRRWSKDEIKDLKSRYSFESTSKIAKDLNRTKSSVRYKANSIGIFKKKKLEKDEKKSISKLFESGEDVKDISKKLKIPSNLVFDYLCSSERLERMYHSEDMTQKEIANEIGTDQSVISEKMKDFGIETKSSKFWSEDEEEILEENYLELSREKLMSLLPNRSWDAIKSKAFKLGLCRTEEEYRKSEEVKARLKSYSRQNTIEVDFQEKDKLSYILGVLDGDGFHDGTYTIGLEVISEKFANKFYRALKSIGLNPGRGEREGDKETVWASSKQLINWYEELGREEKLEWLLGEGDCYSYIEGRYESDGNMHPTGALRITSTDPKEIKFMEKLFSYLEIQPSIQKENIWISKVDSEKFFEKVNPVIKDKSYYDSDKEG